jgi:hypothetical protein
MEREVKIPMLEKARESSPSENTHNDFNAIKRK